jgi:hypothetical protein
LQQAYSSVAESSNMQAKSSGEGLLWTGMAVISRSLA